MRLEGKVALVSGGARGLGAAQARLMAAEGAPVLVGDVLEDEGLAVVADIKARGGQALFMPLDVTSERDWERAVAAAVNTFGKLNVLVNNAGIFRRATFDETTVEGWDEVMDVNAKGVFLGTRTALAPMRASGGGSIVNISSIAGLVGSSISAAYNASKGAVRIMTKSAALQYAADGIRVNSVHPPAFRYGHAARGVPRRGGPGQAAGPPHRWTATARPRTWPTPYSSWLPTRPHS